MSGKLLRKDLIQKIQKMMHSEITEYDAISKIAPLLADYIPADRISLGCGRLHRWYFYCDGQFKTNETEISRGKNWNASRSAFATGKPILRKNISKERGFGLDASLISEGMASDLILPLRHQQTIWGTLNFTSKEIAKYGEKDLRRILPVSHTIASGLQRQQKQRESMVVQRIFREMNFGAGRDELLLEVIDAIIEQGFDCVRVFAFCKKRNAFIGIKQVGIGPKEKFENKAFEAQDCGFGLLVDQFLRLKIQRELPLLCYTEGKPVLVGKLVVGNPISEIHISQEEIDDLVTLASLIALLIQEGGIVQKVLDTTPCYTSGEAADLLGISLGWLRRLARLRNVGVRVGRSWLYSESDIENLRRKPWDAGFVRGM